MKKTYGLSKLLDIRKESLNLKSLSVAGSGFRMRIEAGAISQVRILPGMRLSRTVVSRDRLSGDQVICISSAEVSQVNEPLHEVLSA